MWAGTHLSARNHCVWVLLAVVVIVIVLFIFSQSADVVLALGLSADGLELALSVSHTLHGRELSSASAVCDARVAHIVASQGLLVTSRRLLGERALEAEAGEQRARQRIASDACLPAQMTGVGASSARCDRQRSSGGLWCGPSPEGAVCRRRLR